MKKMLPRPYTVLIHLCLAIMWPATAVAATSLIEIFKGYSLLLFSVLFVISTLSGLTSLIVSLEIFLKENEGKLPQFMKLYITARILGSWLGGLVGVALSNTAELNGWNLLLTVIAFSFGGIQVIQRLYEKLVGNQLMKGTT